MAIIQTGTFSVVLGGAAQNLNLGFVPDVLTLWNDTKLASQTGVAYAQWLSSMANASAYIQTLTGGAPVWSKLTTNGVTPYMTPLGQEYVPLSGLPPGATSTNLTITAISKAANASITATHAFTAADIGVTTVGFHGVVGMTQINTLTGLITDVTSTTSFTVNINSSAFSTYVSGGIANIISGVPAVTQTGFQVYNTPLYNVSIIGVTLGTSLMVTTSDLFRYEAVLNTPVTS
jgi:hypothetical protein